MHRSIASRRSSADGTVPSSYQPLTHQGGDGQENLSEQPRKRRGSTSTDDDRVHRRASSNFHETLQGEAQDLEEWEEGVKLRLEAAEAAYRKTSSMLQRELETVQQQRQELERKDDLLAQDEDAEVASGPAWMAWVNNSLFRNVCMVVILANMVAMCVELQHKNASLFHTMDDLFLAYYCFELIVKAVYFQKGLLVGTISVVWWNWLDLVIVVSGIFDQWVLPSLTHGATGGLKNLRCLRLLRLFRVARALKLVRVFLRSDLSWVEGPEFETFMMLVIMANAVLMWLELDFPWAGWIWVEHLLLTIYLFELCARLKRLGAYFFTGDERQWNIMDFAIVVGGVMDQWAIPLYDLVIILILGASAHVSHARLTSFMKILRVLRIIRVLRLARVMRHVRPLHRLLSGILEAMTAMGWVLVLTFLLLYSAAIIFTTLVGRGFIYGGDDEMPAEALDNFSSVAKSMLSLFKLMNDDQGVVAPVITTVTGQLMFYVFMMLSNWMMLAILTSVVSDNMISCSQKCEEEDRAQLEEAMEIMVSRNLLEFFHKFDVERTGRVSHAEYMQMLTDPELSSRLCDITGFELQDIEDMFSSLGKYTDKGDQYLPYRTFISKLRQYHSNASERSILSLMETLKFMEAELVLKMDKVLDCVGCNKEEHDDIKAKIEAGKRAPSAVRTLQSRPKRAVTSKSLGSGSSPLSQILPPSLPQTPMHKSSSDHSSP